MRGSWNLDTICKWFGSIVEPFYMDARNTYQYFIMHITFPAKGQLAYSMTAARFLLEIMNMI